MVRNIIQRLVIGAVRVSNDNRGFGRVLVSKPLNEEPLTLQAYTQAYTEVD